MAGLEDNMGTDPPAKSLPRQMGVVEAGPRCTPYCFPISMGLGYPVACRTLQQPAGLLLRSQDLEGGPVSPKSMQLPSHMA